MKWTGHHQILFVDEKQLYGIKMIIGVFGQIRMLYFHVYFLEKGVIEMKIYELVLTTSRKAGCLT